MKLKFSFSWSLQSSTNIRLKAVNIIWLEVFLFQFNSLRMSFFSYFSILQVIALASIVCECFIKLNFALCKILNFSQLLSHRQHLRGQEETKLSRNSYFHHFFLGFRERRSRDDNFISRSGTDFLFTWNCCLFTHFCIFCRILK